MIVKHVKDTINNIPTIVKTLKLKVAKERNLFKPTELIIKPIIKDTSKVPLNKLNGLQILKIKIKPVIPTIITHKVEDVVVLKLKIAVKMTIIKMLITIVKAAGMDVAMTLPKNLPWTFSSLGSKAKINDGIPIVKTLVKVSCTGIKG